MLFLAVAVACVAAPAAGPTAPTTPAATGPNGPSAALAPITVSAGGVSYPAFSITGSTAATVTAPLVFGGLGDFPTAAWRGKVVLLDRGVLTFGSKIKNVQSAGGVAVIIANIAAGPTITSGTMVPDTYSGPAVFVTYADGVALKTAAGTDVKVDVPKPPPPPPPAPILPDPTGHDGEFLSVEAGKYVFVKSPPLPVGVLVKTEAADGESVIFSVTASGTPPFTYVWYKNGQPIPGESNSTLVISAVKLTDAGTYVCQVSNPKGTALSNTHTIFVR